MINAGAATSALLTSSCGSFLGSRLNSTFTSLLSEGLLSMFAKFTTITLKSNSSLACFFVSRLSIVSNPKSPNSSKSSCLSVPSNSSRGQLQK